MEKRILKKENEVAEFFGWSRQTLANRRWNGDGPPYLKLSARCVRYDMEEVLKWAQAHEVRPGEQAA